MTMKVYIKLTLYGTFLLQPMTMDAYSRMAALYQHLHQHPASSARSQGL